MLLFFLEAQLNFFVDFSCYRIVLNSEILKQAKPLEEKVNYEDHDNCELSQFIPMIGANKAVRNIGG